MDSVLFYNKNKNVIRKKKLEFYLSYKPIYRVVSVLPVGSWCDLNCDYCYFHNNKKRQDLTQERLLSFLESIKVRLDINVNFLITGGNPFLSNELLSISDTINTFCKNNNIKNRNSYFYISGYLEQLKKILSYDSNSEFYFTSDFIDSRNSGKTSLDDFFYMYNNFSNERMKFLLTIQFSKKTNLNALKDLIQFLIQKEITFRLRYTYSLDTPSVDFMQNLISFISQYNPKPIMPSFDYLVFNYDKKLHYPYMEVDGKKYISFLATNHILKMTIGISPDYYFAGTFEKFKTKNLEDITDNNEQFFTDIFNFIYKEKKCSNCEFQYMCFVCPFYKKFCNESLKLWVKYLLSLTEAMILSDS